MAKAWLLAFIAEVVQSLHFLCAQYAVQRFFVCGSFANRAFVRHHLTREMVRRDCFCVITNGKVNETREKKKREESDGSAEKRVI